jgi:hypothetical protein
METITKVYNVFKFEELSDGAKDKAREWYREGDGNFYDGWWDYGMIEEELEKIGLSADLKELNFSLDRSDYLFFWKGINVDDPKKFLKSAGVDLRKKDVKDCFDYDGISITTRHFGGGDGKNIVEPDALDNIDLTDYLNSVLDDIKSNLRKESEYMDSDEAVDESIISNEYTFLEDGTRED